MPHIVAVVVTYNPSISELEEQFEAVVAEGIFVVVIDNASANYAELAARLHERRSPRLCLHPNDDNVGLAQAQNQGIEAARRLGASHVVFFDQDSLPEPGFMAALLAAEARLAADGMRFSAVGPAAFDPASGDSYPITRYFGPFIRRYEPRASELVEATFLISSGSMIRMEVIDDVGQMRAELFIDYIDVEWCLRARSHGYRCYVASGARLLHRIGDARVRILGRTISAHSPLRRYYLLRNSVLMLRLAYIPFAYKLREVVLNFLRVAIFWYRSADRPAYLRLMRSALADGLAGRYGKRT